MRYELDTETDVRQWAEDKRSGADKASLSNQDVANLCGSSSKKSDLAKKISEIVGCQKQNAYRYINRAIKAGKLRDSDDHVFHT